jgi:hypothetical protein
MIAGVLVAAGSGFVGWRVGWRLATSHYRERLETQKVIIDDLRNKQEARLNVSSSANAAASREKPDIPHLVPDFIYDGYDETSNRHQDGAIHLYTHLRFCNGTGGAEAKDVSARIEFLEYTYRSLIFQVDAKWEDVDYAGGRSRRAANCIKMLPNMSAHQLDLVARPPNSDDCYALYIESHPNYRQEQYRLRQGLYLAKATLFCQGFSKEFWFRVIINGQTAAVAEMVAAPQEGQFYEFKAELKR